VKIRESFQLRLIVLRRALEESVACTRCVSKKRRRQTRQSIHYCVRAVSCGNAGQFTADREVLPKMAGMDLKRLVQAGALVEGATRIEPSPKPERFSWTSILM
jgi:hypothetical protein